MALKRIPPVLTSAPRASRTARPPVVVTPARAHPRLLHGFLVLLEKVKSRAPGRTAAKGIPTAIGRGRASRRADAANEGPSEDATFH